MKVQKNSITHKIKTVLIVLIPIIILDFFVSFFAVYHYKNQTYHYAKSITELYISQINDNFDKINRFLLNNIIKNSNIKDIEASIKNKQMSKTEKTLLYINSKNSLTDEFEVMRNDYGDEYNYFLYFKDVDEYITSTNENDKEKARFKQIVLDKINNNKIENLHQKEWTLLVTDDASYILQIYNNNENQYIGCSIKTTDLLLPLSKLDYGEESFALLVDKNGHPLVSTEDGNNTGLELSNTKSENNLMGFINKRLVVNNDFEYGEFSIQVVISNGLLQQIVILQVTLMIIAFIITCVVLWMLLYVKKSIFEPIKYFCNNLELYDQAVPFGDNSNLVELEQASKLFNDLACQIRKLKIDIYEEKISKQKIMLDYMQLQIKPHFFLNCLNIIYSMAQTKHYDQIQQLSMNVADYLRYILKSGIEPVEIADEINHIENYLNIQKIQYRSAFNYSIYLDEGMKNHKIPPLIIHTFVENAIKHTVTLDEPVTISVHVNKETIENNQWLTIDICDTGTGFPEDTLEKLHDGIFTNREDGRQIGIINSIQRLNILYAEKAKITFENLDSGGAQVKIFILLEE